MKYLLVAATLSSATFSLQAASLASFDISAKANAKQVCNTATCTAPAKGSYRFDAVVTLTASERDAFNADTRVVVKYDGGVDVNVRLGDDPNFGVGRTSANFNTQSTIMGLDDSKLVQKIALDWSDGELKINIASQFVAVFTSNITHPSETSLSSLIGGDKSTKSHGGYQQNLKIAAVDGSSTEIFSIIGELKSDRTENSKKVENVDGSGTLKLKVSAQSVSFSPSTI